jgi:predicted ATP-binding protein involved in virulence
MNDYFIEKVIIKDVRDIKNLEIPLDKSERKHLIITGKNGCGKTSTLIEINNLLNKLIKKIPMQNLENIQNTSKVDLIFSNKDTIEDSIYKDIINRKFILAYFKAKRENKPIVSSSIQNITLAPNYNTDTNNLHTKFIQYMVRLRVDMLDAKEEKEFDEVKRIKKWFESFENSLKELFGTDELRLKYYRKELNFKIEYEGKSFGLNELSDGYSSLLTILTELILRMEAHNVLAYNMEGVVLVDEIETHLHVALQKKVLPFLTSFFKNIQFIVTTHSPFVLSSLSNAVICDLEKRMITTDLSAYSYDALIESYFDSDKYSKEVKEKIEQFEILADKDNLSDIEKDDYYQLKRYFNTIPTFMADELAVKINEIKLRTMCKIN